MSDDSPIDQWFSTQGSENIFTPVGNGNPIIARGAFGEISTAIHKKGDRWRLAVVKQVFQCTTGNGNMLCTLGTTPSDKAKLSREVFHEICALRLLNPHPNIVELLAIYPSKGNAMVGKHLSFAFSYCPIDLHGTLEWRRRALMPQLPFQVIKGIAFDMFSALHHCHESGINHFDIKPGNFLVSSTGYIQLCDFGLAKPNKQQTDNNGPEEETRGLCTLYYRPPELLLGGSAESAAVDMFSAGLVLAELVTGFPMFCGDSAIGQLACMFELLGSPNETTWPEVIHLPDYGKLHFAHQPARALGTVIPRAQESPRLLQLLEGLLILNPSKRLSANQALQHEWFTTLAGNAIDRSLLQEFLIPQSVQEPILLSQETDLSVASRKALEVAAARRSLLASSQRWKNPTKNREQLQSLRMCCSQLCPALANNR